MFFSAVLVFHFLTLTAPIPNGDEALYAIDAMYGTNNLWRPLLFPQEYLLLHVTDMPLFPVYLLILKTTFSILGPGLVQVRLPGLMAGLLGLFIIALSVKRKDSLSSAGWMGAMWLSFHYFFFMCTHSARQEGFELLLTAASYLVLVSQVNPVVCAMIGILAGLGVGIHPVVLVGYLAGLTSSLILERRATKQTFSWLLGLGIGFVLLLAYIDLDSVLLFWNRTRGSYIDLPPVVRYHGNLFEIFRNSPIFKNPEISWVLGTALAASIASLFATGSSSNDRSFAMMGCIYLGIYFLFNPSLTASAISYLVAILPWLVVALFLYASRLIRADGSMEPREVFVYSLSTALLMYFFSYHGGLPLIFYLPVMVLFFRIAAGLSGKFNRYGLILLISISGLIVFDRSRLVEFYSMLPFLGKHHPLGLAFALLAGFVPKISGVNLGFGTAKIKINHFFLGHLFAIFLFTSWYSVKLIWHQMPTVKAGNKFTANLEQFRGKSIFGPDYLVLYDPSLTVYGIGLFGGTREKIFLPNLVKRLERIKPDLMLWPNDDFQALERPMKNHLGQFSTGLVWHGIDKDYQQFFIEQKGMKRGRVMTSKSG